MNKLKKIWRDRDVYALLYREYIIGFVIGFLVGAIYYKRNYTGDIKYTRMYK